MNAKQFKYNFNFFDSKEPVFTFHVFAQNELEAKALLLEKVENESFRKLIGEKLIGSLSSFAQEVKNILDPSWGFDGFSAGKDYYEEIDLILEHNAHQDNLHPFWIGQFIDEPWYKHN